MFAYRTQNTNEELVETYRSYNFIKNSKVLDAFKAIPRGLFIPPSLQGVAYNEHPIRYSELSFNISSPRVHAICLDYLNIQPGMKFLDIGSGCGHVTTMAAWLVGETGVSHGYELVPEIIKFSLDNIARAEKTLNISFKNIKITLRNCFIPDFYDILYDRIHVGASCPLKLLHVLSNMLAPGGILLTPSGNDLLKISVDHSNPPKPTKESVLAVIYGELIIPPVATIESAIFEIKDIQQIVAAWKAAVMKAADQSDNYLKLLKPDIIKYLMPFLSVHPTQYRILVEQRKQLTAPNKTSTAAV